MTRRRFQRTNRGSVSRRELLLTVSLVVLAGVAVLSLGFTYTYGEDPAESLLTADTPPNMTEYDSPEAAADDMGQADALYLLADDSAVLVYESDSSAGAGATQLGADVTQQLTELLLGLSGGTASELDPAGENTDTSGGDEPTETTALGSFDLEQSLDQLFAQPTSNTELTLDVDGEYSPDANEFDASLSSTMPITDVPGPVGAGSTEMTRTEDRTPVQSVSEPPMSAETSGTMELTPETVTTSGQWAVVHERAPEEAVPDTKLDGNTTPTATTDLTLADGGLSDGYRLSVSQLEYVDTTDEDVDEDFLSDRTAISNALEAEYDTIAAAFDGESRVELHHHEYETVGMGGAGDEGEGEGEDEDEGEGEGEGEDEGETAQLELEYTVTYTGIDDGIETMLATELADHSQVSTQEAAEIASGVTALDLETVAVSRTTTQTETETRTVVDWDVAVGNYQETARALAGVAVSGDKNETTANTTEDTPAANLTTDERVAETLAAQATANLRTTTEWNASIDVVDVDEEGDGNHEQTAAAPQATVDATVTGMTDNWSEYVEERTDRGFEEPAAVSFSLAATDVDGELDLHGEFELPQSTVADRTLGFITESLGPDPLSGPAGSQFTSLLEEWNLDLTRTSIELGEDTVRISSGATVADLGTLVDQVGPAELVPGGTAVEDQPSQTYVHVADLDLPPTVDRESPGQELESLPVVDAETELHGVGVWDRDGLAVADESESESEAETETTAEP
ncbi:uncharacterized protein Nmag_0261 [Natrialba magadii ATCC 43099]|uniref:Uncharacterized protein n=1 Tax=Natrialba magadii (strain ATCC 43099 / DSM 3394 / CCM 3739 / CIP 104546 / IAM 13178 / JCM 8861 / NBRC 102185 / NCIMB 2190 / MS3) TaxID=547559 RepID=D3SX33_NATMM|nr:hypothetical protein [Natrialba magadii]ADD03853.1 uncharacterized protein Nmag_0261 [Natrialba magadii ATCC 43099]ELY33512.1 hypothetical protein C500_01730 [Natrialba magadii ATCC 43099]